MGATSNPFADFDSVFQDSITLPIRGVEYTIPCPDSETCLWIQRVAAAGIAIANGGEPGPAPKLDLDDDEELQLYQRLLTTQYDAINGAAGFMAVKESAQTVMYWVVGGLDVAVAYWSGGGKPPKRIPSNRAERRTSPKTPTAGASTTRKAASGKGTSTRRTSSAH